MSEARAVVADDFPDPRRMSIEEIDGAVNDLDERARYHALAQAAKQHRSNLLIELQERATAQLVDTKRLQVVVEKLAENLEARYAEALTRQADFVAAVEAVATARPAYESAWAAGAKHGITPLRVPRMSERISNDSDLRNLSERMRRALSANW